MGPHKGDDPLAQAQHPHPIQPLSRQGFHLQYKHAVFQAITFQPIGIPSPNRLHYLEQVLALAGPPKKFLVGATTAAAWSFLMS